MDQLNRLVGGWCKAFLLTTGELLLVNSLASLTQPGEANSKATHLLRYAVDDPGGEVRGYALLVRPHEFDLLPWPLQMARVPGWTELRTILLLDHDHEVRSEQTALFLDRIEAARTALLLECNEGVRSVVALGLERDHFRVIHAHTAAEAVEFCESHALHLLVADVSSLRPQPLEALRSVQEAQPQAQVLLISGYEQDTVAALYPDLLTGVEFLQKPFLLSLMAKAIHGIGVGTKPAWRFTKGRVPPTKRTNRYERANAGNAQSSGSANQGSSDKKRLVAEGHGQGCWHE